ncbi:MAG TPA: hypothetical protein VGA78_05945 [Gemmatimonadales bacterium]|jgi:hypothetical protein
MTSRTGGPAGVVPVAIRLALWIRVSRRGGAGLGDYDIFVMREDGTEVSPAHQ